MSDTEPTPAVLYAAKSTEDRHGSIPTQLEDGRALAERQGWRVVGEFSDEGFSAYKGNRGPGLARAKEAAVANAPCVLVVQDLDRLARGAGDKPGAADHLGELFFAMRRQSVTLWSARSGEVDSLRAVLEGERSHSESERKSQATRAGLKRRAERGKPVGAVPLGYTVEHAVVDGQPVTRRGEDERGAALYERMVSEAERGLTPGQIARGLNAEGHLTRRGKQWTHRAVRTILRNPDYLGDSGYPALITRELWDAVQAQLARLDPVYVQARKGGRRPADTDAYVLRGVGRCLWCGSTLYTRKRQSGERTYICGAVREAKGICSAKAFPAELAESVVIRHLSMFVGDVEGWLSQIAEGQEAEQRVRLDEIDRKRARLTDLGAERERIAAHYRKLAAAGKERKAEFVLEQVGRVDDELAVARSDVDDAEARAAEWSEPTMDGALDVYNDLVAVVRGRIDRAHGVQELRAALRDVLAGLYLGLDESGQLRGEFALRRGLTPTNSLDARWQTALGLGRALAAEARSEDARAEQAPQTFV